VITAYYINLDRVPERRDFIESHFPNRQISNIIRLSATDAKDPSALTNAGFRSGIGGRWDMPRSAIACFESHRRVWQQIGNEDLAAAAVFEDDVYLSDTASDVIARLMDAPEKYDIVKIDYSPKFLRFGPELDVNGVILRSILQTMSSAGGYILSRSGCRKLLECSSEYGDHLDDFVFMPRPGWSVYQVFPAVAVQLVLIEGNTGSDLAGGFTLSERTSDPVINDQPQKGPLSFRIRKELGRVARKFHWRFGGDARLIREGGFIGNISLAPDLQEDSTKNH